MNTEDKRPRILLISDSCSIDTGMGVAIREIAYRLYQTKKYSIASFGWFWESAKQRGLKWKFPWKQYATSDQQRPYGHPIGWVADYNKPSGDFENSPVNKVILEFKPDIVIAIGDVWMVDYLYFLPTRDTFKLIHEFPIDGEPVPPSWIKLVRNADLPVVMSKFALKVCHDVDPYLYIEHIPRGVATNNFKPYPNKDNLRKRYLPSTEGRFIIGVFDRFQDRKQVPRAIEGFAKFKRMHTKDDCDLYLHMDVNDSHSLNQKKHLIGENSVIDRYGIANSILINKDVTVEKGVSLEKLVGLYNSCDVKLSTTQGEGFGLTTLEAMSCGIPCIGTHYTTMPELLAEGRGLTAGVSTFITGMYNVERALVDTDDVARCLETLYRSKKLRESMSQKGREFALTLDWSIVIQYWENIIDRLLKRREYGLINKPRAISFDRDVQEVNVQGAIYENTGFSIVTAGFARGLSKLGHDVSIQPRLEDNPHGVIIAEDIKSFIDKERNNDVEIINHMPDECVKRIDDSVARIKVVYFPWELTEVKDDWIDLVNRKADACWCNSHFIKDILVRNGACPEKIAVIPNGICINCEAEPYPLKTKKRYKFLMVGNLGDIRKNVGTLIQSYLATFTADDDVCMVLKSQPGHQDSDPSELCESMMRSYVNPPEFEVIHDDMPDLSGLYKACDVFITASRAEGFCQPMLDALSVGMLVIAPNYGGYLDFTDVNKRFAGLEAKLESAHKSPVYLPGSLWCEIDFKSMTLAMRKAYEAKLKRDGKNYVPDYTWDNAGKRIVEEIKGLEKRKLKKKCYYENFTINLWNDDNRQNIMRYAPHNVEFTSDPQEADFQILDIAKLADFKNVRCKRFIVNFHCRGEWSEENIKDYLQNFNQATMVYSHLDLQGELPTLKNFVRGPWGTNHRNFYREHGNIHRYIILTTGLIPQTEGIYESVMAAEILGKEALHTGPNLGIKNKAYTVPRERLSIDQMRNMYHFCTYTSGMRRIEGFEKTVAEGLLCGSRPICFDTSLYKYWYGNLVEYVREGTQQETMEDLVEIFKSEPRIVTDKEREVTKRSFAWMNVAPAYWKSIKKYMGGV